MKKTIAILSDVHGNYTALLSVINDIKTNQVDETWFLGDLIMPGTGGDDLFDLLNEVHTTVFLRGNWDDCLFEVLDSTDPFNFEDSADVYVGILTQYVYAHLSKKNIEKLRSAPISLEKTVNGVKIQISHNLPNINYGPDLIAQADTPAFNQLFDTEHTDIAVYGHIHHQVLRYSSLDQLVINPGSIGMAYSKHTRLNKDRRAQYALLTIDDSGVSNVDFKKVNYDISQEAHRADSYNLPYAALYQESIKTGISRVSDGELLATINEANGYISQLKQFLLHEQKRLTK